ncbi:MAG: L,D-transpeptidase/peptidoglycan binding protein [Candidatus Gastranaerophilales bacterium]|nr:L,D-transpeptidase/peptidoglycan binding protein [Candidatus Gastranaerophilales bacterium]
MTERRKGAVFRKIIFAVLLLTVLVFAGYFLLAFYYRSGFSLNTWINGIYCTGKTVEEVNEELLSQTEAPVVIIQLDSGWDSIYPNEIDLGEMGYTCDYLPVLEAYMEQQNPLLWVDNILFHREHRIVPQITYDEDALREAFEQTCVQHYSDRVSGIYTIGIDWKSGWWHFDGLTHQIDMDRAFELLKESVAAGIYEVNIDEMDCFYDIPFTEEQERIREVWERLDVFQNCDIVYDMGDENIKITPELAAHFLLYERREDLWEGGMDFPVLTEDGQFVLDEEAVRAYVADLAETYDTYGKDREFMSTRGDLVTVPAGGTYGTLLDQEAEVAYLMENLLTAECHAGEEVLHIPAYEMQGVARGRNDIGSTYIEVDMTQQKMYYYEEGELVIETDIVTGNTGRRMGTPQGVNFVYNKQRNRVLRGPGYASRVSYWVPVKGNIGIHDASWRSEFGGELYQTGGSHGCINTPTDVMAELYEKVEIGTPVVMFY